MDLKGAGFDQAELDEGVQTDTSSNSAPTVAIAWLALVAAARRVIATAPSAPAPNINIQPAAMTRPKSASGDSVWRSDVAATARSVSPQDQHKPPMVSGQP